MQYPILYSFRRCPYAIRARMALDYAGIACVLREVVLKDKPQAMLAASLKATVPVLVWDGQVIDESIEIMDWALQKNDPDNWGRAMLRHDLVQQNDDEFKYWLDRYKYADRYPDESAKRSHSKAFEFLELLESHLIENPARQFHLESLQVGALDVAIFPFVRQFAFVDRTLFDELPLPGVHQWLDNLLSAPRFTRIMTKYPQWLPSDPPTLVFGAETHKASHSRL